MKYLQFSFSVLVCGIINLCKFFECITFPSFDHTTERFLILAKQLSTGLVCGKNLTGDFGLSCSILWKQVIKFTLISIQNDVTIISIGKFKLWVHKRSQLQLGYTITLQFMEPCKIFISVIISIFNLYLKPSTILSFS
jgi:hypothetical protein